MFALAMGDFPAAAQDFFLHDTFDDGDVTTATPGGEWVPQNPPSGATVDANSGDLVDNSTGGFTLVPLFSVDGVTVDPRTEWSFRARVTVDVESFAGVGTSVLNHAALVDTLGGGLRAGTSDDNRVIPLPYNFLGEEVFLQMTTRDSQVLASVWKESDDASLVQVSWPYTPTPARPAFGVTGAATYHEAWVSTDPLPLPRIGRLLESSLEYIVVDRDADGLGDNAIVSSEAFRGAGELPLGNETALSRQVIKFELPQLEAALASATLRVFVDDIVGAPTGPLSVFHNASENSLTRSVSDYEESAFLDSQQDLLLPTDPVGQSYEIDVTELIRTDYAMDADPIATFRLQVDGALTINGESDYYSLATTSVNVPRLIIHEVPEPSTFMLLILGAAVVHFTSAGNPARRRHDAAPTQ